MVLLASHSPTRPIHPKNAFSSLPQPKDPALTEDTTPATRSPASSTPAAVVVEYSPVDFAAKSKIEGSESHIVTINLQPGECVRAESGSMVFMTDSIVMNTTLGAGASSAFQRMMTGQNVFLTDFTCDDKPGTLCLGTDFPSKILRLNLQDLPLETLICQRGAYLASNPTVNIEMEFTKSLSAGFFGGQGFILQKLTGTGDVLIKGGGTIVTKDLRDGESLRVSSGSIVAFERTVAYDIQMVPGIKNAMFGGEGLFVTTLTGPGRVWLQGMPPDRMIAEIARRVPSGPGLGFGIPIMVGGGGGGGGGGGDGAGESAAAAGTGAEAAGLSDSAIEADRQATVASSGMESSGGTAVDDSSPSALFGDAAPKEETLASAGSTAPDDPFGSDDSFASNNSSYEEPTFDDTSVSSDEFTPDGSDFADGEFFDDSTSTSASEGASEAAGDEGGSSIFQTLWDMFMGDDDD